MFNTGVNLSESNLSNRWFSESVGPQVKTRHGAGMDYPGESPTPGLSTPRDRTQAVAIAVRRGITQL
jgi:hypothetical protein